MQIIKSQKKRFFIFLAVCFTVMLVSYIRTVSVMPGEITMLEGEEYVYDFKSPFLVSINADGDGVLTINNGKINRNNSFIKLSGPLALKTQRNGNVNLILRIFGFIPLKTMKVDIVPYRKVVACGNTVGVKLKMNGVLVIGISDVETLDGSSILPVRDCGIRAGDLLVEVNKTKLNNIEDLVDQIEKSHGEKIYLKYKRGSITNDVEVKAVKARDDNKYHIGLWVRDSTAGIGTLTFYDPETKLFGALGHGITDIDTGSLMPVETGEILESNILAIKKGKQGNPGELKGVFTEDKNILGIINLNCEYGIYGKLNNNMLDKFSSRQYTVATRNQIKEGPASILANIDGKKVDEYSIEVQKVSRQNQVGSKGMIIKITDKRLLDETGGIVQGMSGSPIIQNEKIIGAVTHVLVNDPTKGYGVFIENMLKNLNKNNEEQLPKAG